MKVFIDLFCGAGGISEGAYRASFDKIVAIDMWEKALEIHKLLIPSSICVNMELGSNMDNTHDFIRKVGEIDDTDIIHCHASPPCQLLSKVNKKRNHDSGLILVKWSLDFMQKFYGNSTWTLEQVHSKKVLNLLSTYENIFFKVVDFSHYNVAQKRKRIIVCNKDVFNLIPKNFVPLSCILDNLPSELSFIGNSFCSLTKSLQGIDKNLKPYVKGETVSYTVTGKPMYLFDKDMRKIRTFSVYETARIQSFSIESSKIFEKKLSKKDGYQMVGNSVPPEFIYNFMKCLLQLPPS